MALLRSARMRVPRPLVPLLAVALLLGIAWATVVPPFQGPDENDHFAYVQRLAETGTAPSPTRAGGAGSHSTEVQRALVGLGLTATMGNAGARPVWNAAALADWRRFDHALPGAGRADGAGPNPIAKNPPLYYAVAAVAYAVTPGRSLFAHLFASRLVGVLLFTLTVALTWVAASELTTRAWARVLATGVVALQPQLAFMAGIVNADTLLVAIWTAFVALTVRTLNRGPTTGRVLGLFALAALSPLTHGRGLALLPPLAVVLALTAWRHRPQWRRALAWAAGGAAVLGAGLLAFWLFTSNTDGGGSLYGGQTGYIHQGGFSVGGLLENVWRFYFPPLPGMGARLGPSFGFRQMWVETFYGKFGSLDASFPHRVYSLLRYGTILLVLMTLAALVVRRRELRRDWPVLAGLASIGLSLLALLHLVSYLSLIDTGDTLIVGRYGLPLVSLLGLAVAFVATSLPRRVGPLAAAGVLALGVLLQLGGLGITVVRFYG